MKRFLTLIFVLELIITINVYTQWRDEANGLQAQSINCLARCGDYLIAVTQYSQMFFSKTDSIDWIEKGFQYANILSLTTTQNCIYVGTTRGVYLSTDIGDNWTIKKSGLQNTIVNTMNIKGDSIFAGTDQGLYLSTDSGNNWTICLNDFSNKPIYSILISGTTILVGSSNGLLYISNDNGSSWMTKDLGANYSKVLSIFINGSNIYAGVEHKNEESLGGLFLSADNGNTWSRKINDLSYKNILCFAVIDDKIFAGTEKDGVYYSTNKGKSWDEIYKGLPSRIIKALFVNDNTLLVGTISGVAKTTDDYSQWVPINKGLKNHIIKSIYLNKNNIITRNDRVLSTSSDNGYNWTPMFQTDDCLISSLAFYDSLTFIDLGGGRFYVTRDNFKSFQFVLKDHNMLAITSLSIRGDQILAGTDPDGFCIFYNLGDVWAGKKLGLSYLTIRCILNFDNYIYLGTDRGIHFTSDDGLTWSQQTKDLYGYDINTIVHVSDKLYSGTTKGFISSTDGGENWIVKNSGLTNLNVLSLVAGDNYIFAGTDDGVFLSTDNGDNWVAKNDGLVNTNIYSLAVKDNTVFLGNRYTIYRAELSDFGITDVNDSPLQENLDFTISPNPAIENIRISLKSDLQNANIKITNAQGVEFFDNYYAYLMKDNPSEIDTKELPIGIYFCTINSGNLVATQKFVVIR